MIGAIGSAQFAGWAISSIFVSRLGDLYGRRKPFLVSLYAACILQASILIVTDLRVVILLFFLLGLTQAGKFSLASVYL